MIRLENLSKQLGDFEVQDINLKLKDDEYFVILGPTGTGKSILLELIAGLQTPDTGQIYFDDLEVSQLLPEERKIGMVYQDYMLFPHLNVKENIMYGLEVRQEDTQAG
ncbi:MAG: ATP-binding cassette domain-containing protein, partial [Bacillota bacterium]